MTGANALALACVVLGGMAVATQAPINAVLGRASGSFILAAGISFGVGFVLLVALAGVRGNLGALASLGTVPWWAWSGGVLGAFFVWANVSGVGKLGVVTTFAGVVLGQMLAALVMDATGAFGVPVHAVSWQRIAAVAMVVGGLFLSRA
ncbi:DMT family transporter [Rhizobiaceae bacterium]|nr:DMT family transporter [Rhizobiaceae bacterium]